MENKIKKVCSSCNQEKEIIEFSKDKTEKDGYTYTCKVCRNKKYNEWAKNNPEKVKQKNLKNQEKRKAFYKSERGIKSSRKTHLKRKYNITLEQYNEILEKQNGVCKICNNPENCSRNTFLAVDHSHDNNKIRGLLCTNCNRALGLFKDDIELLQNAINYLKQYKQI